MSASDAHSSPPRTARRHVAPKMRTEREALRLLNERVKELECIHTISRLFDRREATVEETLRAIVEVIPRAWQHPELAEASITLRDRTFTTTGFCESEWQHSSPILAQNEVVGRLTVCYREEPPGDGDGIFLAEEQNLLNTIAQRLGGFVERRWTLKSLLTYQEDLRRLASALSLSEQQERRRIAEGLHDHIGQNLALVNMRLGAAQQTSSLSEATVIIAEAREILSDVISETRTLTFELCPPILYELGLAAALDWLAEQAEATYGFAVIVREHGEPVTLREDLSTTLFQVAREILTNAGRHARATTVNLDLFNDEKQVRLVVQDNGRGFDAVEVEARAQPQRGFGLFSIRERLRFMGGTFELRTERGHGTTVSLAVPRLAHGQEEEALRVVEGDVS